MTPKEIRRKMADGPVMLNEINQDNAWRFAHRWCITCGGPIMLHWLVESNDPNLMGTWWCDPDRNQASEGMNLPEDVKPIRDELPDYKEPQFTIKDVHSEE